MIENARDGYLLKKMKMVNTRCIFSSLFSSSQAMENILSTKLKLLHRDLTLFSSRILDRFVRCVALLLADDPIIVLVKKERLLRTYEGSKLSVEPL